MWKKSVSTLLLFLFTVCPMNPVWAMDGYQKFDEEYSSSRYPSPQYIENFGSKFITNESFLQQGSKWRQVPLFVAAIPLEMINRSMQALAKVPGAFIGIKPATLLTVVEYTAILAALLLTAGIPIPTTFEHVYSAFGLANATSHSDIDLSQDAQLNLDAMGTISLNEEFPPFPNISSVNTSIPFPPYPLGNFSIPSALPDAPLPQVPQVLPPSLLPPLVAGPVVAPISLPDDKMLQDAYNKLVASFQDYYGEKTQAIFDTLLAQVNSFKESLPQGINLQEKFAIHLPVSVSKSFHTAFGSQNQTSIEERIDVGSKISAFLGNFSSGVIKYDAVLALYLWNKAFLVHVLASPDCPRPIESFLCTKFFNVKPMNEENVEEANDSSCWQKARAVLKHPCTLASYSTSMFVGSLLTAYAVAAGGLNKLHNLSYEFPLDTPPASATNLSLSEFNLNNTYDFAVGQIQVDLTGQQRADLNASTSFDGLVYFTLSGLSQIDNPELPLIIGMFLIFLPMAGHLFAVLNR